MMNRHPVDGARIIMESEEELELAAVVAYEHHIMLDGGGYPADALSRGRARSPAGWCTCATSSTRCAPSVRTGSAWAIEKVAELPRRASRHRVRPRSRGGVRPDDARRRGPGHRPQRRASRAHVTVLELSLALDANCACLQGVRCI